MHLILFLVLMTCLLDHLFLRSTLLIQEPNCYRLDSVGNTSFEPCSRLENKGWKLHCMAEYSIYRW